MMLENSISVPGLTSLKSLVTKTQSSVLILALTCYIYIDFLFLKAFLYLSCRIQKTSLPRNCSETNKSKIDPTIIHIVSNFPQFNGKLQCSLPCSAVFLKPECYVSIKSSPHPTFISSSGMESGTHHVSSLFQRKLR